MIFATVASTWAQGRLEGRVYIDADKNGEFGSADTPLVGKVISIAGAAGFFTARTNEAGVYRSGALERGVYSVRGPNEAGLVPLRPETNEFNLNIVEPSRADFAYDLNCARVEILKILWRTDGSGCFDMTFRLQSFAPYPVSHLFSMNPVPVVIQSPLSGTANYIPINLAAYDGVPGGADSGVYTVTVCGVPPNSTFTWNFELHTADFGQCCPGRTRIEVPDNKCFQVVDQRISCREDGSVEWCFDIQSLYDRPIRNVSITPNPATLNISPAVFPVDFIKYGQRFDQCVIIRGAIPGTTLNLPVTFYDEFGLRCCTLVLPVPIPTCSCALPAECFGRKPFYEGNNPGSPGWIPASSSAAATSYGIQFTGDVGVVTCGVDLTGAPNITSLDDPVVSIQNLKGYRSGTVPLNTDWVPANEHRGYHGPTTVSAPKGLWNLRNLGSVFGCTLDRFGNIFVTHTSAYGSRVDWSGAIIPATGDRLGALAGGNGGVVYLIRRIDGRVFRYATLPNVTPTGDVDHFPALGNLSYDGTRDQLFVTNLEDGRIYRLDGTAGSFAKVTGTVQSTFDPDNLAAGWSADNGSGGMVNLSDRLWGVEYHRNRVYFARWRTDNNFPSNLRNEIWSVELDTFGNFTNNYQLEVTIPWLSTTHPQYSWANWSMPVADIEFSVDGKMMIAERGFATLPANAPQKPFYWTTTDYADSAHKARVLEYVCRDERWVPSTALFGVGDLGGETVNSAGGIDYDYTPDTTPNVANDGPRVWIMGNAHLNTTVYGLQGTLPTGGGSPQSILQDLNGVLTWEDKTWLGDVEIPCLDIGAVTGTIALEPNIGTEGRLLKIEIFRTGTDQSLAVFEQRLGPDGRFQFSVDPTWGRIDVAATTKCFLRKKIRDLDSTLLVDSIEYRLLPGDIDGDNAVTVFDYLIVSTCFDIKRGDPHWLDPGEFGVAAADADIDGDGIVSIFDYILLSHNFDEVGD